VIVKVIDVEQKVENSESRKIGLLETRLKELDTKIAEEQNSEGKISLLLKYKILSQEYCMQIRESYGRLLSESVQNYQEALNAAEVFKNQASVFSGLFETEQGRNSNSLSDLCTKLIENPRCVIDEAFRALECELKKNNPDVQLTVRLNFITRLVIALKLVFSKKI
jgi:hypothetical protein